MEDRFIDEIENIGETGEKYREVMGMTEQEKRELASKICEGNLEAQTIFNQLMSDCENVYYVSCCDALDIRGAKFYTLYNDCCDGNVSKFRITMAMFNCGIFNKISIHENLDLPKPLSFIDDSIVIDGFDPEVGLTETTDTETWKTYCVANRRAYIDKLNKIIGSQTVDDLAGYYQDDSGNWWVSYEDYLLFTKSSAVLDDSKQK